MLVTGGLGFIGLNTCARLLDLGAEVTALDNFVPPRITPDFDAIRLRLRLAVADIRDEEKVERVVRDQEVVFNLAGKSGAADSNKTPLNDLDINCRGHLTILEACRTFNPGVTIVFPSSRLVYGKPLYLPVDEKHPLAPESIYAAHKLAVENYHLIYGKLYGLKTTVLRISNPYGPFQAGEGRAYGIANSFIQAAVAGRPITLFGDGRQRRDYLYIDDLVEALLLAAAAPESRGRVYNIGDGQGTSLLELAELAVAAAGQGKIVHVPWPEEYRAIETGDYLSDIGLAQHDLDWSPGTDIREGVARTVEFYKL
ncbi:NAD(P)-dependent oxidoreductase [Geobacter sp. AOG2]|uniref:NAD-dependent epimerase/dehydratase family protein n=1 Tax=Geobacter sp. AOG2 TaxID=1566347 RepID=UPI001CC7523F|nr:NAD-dependent epimerase/dehydratase family protein [Geobacter sp. AOG2]